MMVMWNARDIIEYDRKRPVSCLMQEKTAYVCNICNALVAQKKCQSIGPQRVENHTRRLC